MLLGVTSASSLKVGSKDHVALRGLNSISDDKETHVITVPLESDNVPPGYAVYSIPPFSVTFVTLNTLSGDMQTDISLLESQVAKPLKQIVGQYVQESFALESAELSLKDMTTHDKHIHQMLLDFVNVDFEVSLQHAHAPNAARRHVRALDQTDGGDTDTNAFDDEDFYVMLYAEFDGLAFFVQPTEKKNFMPDSEMMGILGAWMNKYTQDLTEITASFQASTVPLLSNVQSVNIDSNIDTKGDSNDDTTNAVVPEDSENKVVHAILTILVIIVCIALLAMGVALFKYSYPYICSDHSIDATHKNNHSGRGLPGVFNGGVGGGADNDRPMSPHRSNGSDHSMPGNNDPLPGRRGDADEEGLMRQQSDQWLMKHRPDLYNAVQKAQATPTNGKAKYPFDEPGSAGKSPPPRRSLPMQFLLGGMFKTHSEEPQLSTPHDIEGQRHSGHESSDDSSVVFNDEEENSANYMNSNNHWWNVLMTSLQGKKLACDEDPTQYDFPFQDFPRHDGTPCLIYYGEDEDGTRVVREGDGSGRPLSPTDLLSNEEFKRVLSLNSEDGGIAIDGQNGSGEEGDASMMLDDNEEDILFTSADFTEKLERLIAMRHRHYERQNILIKHKKAKEEKRNRVEQEEKARVMQLQEEARQLKLQDEARQRELKLRRHEMELDMNEIEAQFSPRAMMLSRGDSMSNTASAVVSPLKANGSSNNLASSIGNSSFTNFGISSSPGGGSSFGPVSSRSHKTSASDPDLYAMAAMSSTSMTNGRNNSDSGRSSRGSGFGVVESGDLPGESRPDGLAPSPKGLHRKQKTSSSSLAAALANTNKRGSPPRPRSKTSSATSPIRVPAIPPSSATSEADELFSPPAPVRTMKVISPDQDSPSSPARDGTATFASTPPQHQQQSLSVIKPKIGGRQRSHRRWSSYGTGALESPPADGSLHTQTQRRNLSNAEDVMTFGIAAYTNFV